jgi:ribulose-5-phosphate 4-epimerase/fuculose-1-phosphate aldolase
MINQQNITMNSILENRPALRREVEKIAEVAGYLWTNGWAERNGGNITVNITDLVDDNIRQMPAITEPIAIGEHRQAHARPRAPSDGQWQHYPHSR